jgi:hypothetical protein
MTTSGGSSDEPPTNRAPTVPPCPDLKEGHGHGTPTPLVGAAMTGSRRGTVRPRRRRSVVVVLAALAALVSAAGLIAHGVRSTTHGPDDQSTTRPTLSTPAGLDSPGGSPPQATRRGPYSLRCRKPSLGPPVGPMWWSREGGPEIAGTALGISSSP